MEMRPQPFPPAPALLPAPQRGTDHRAPNSPEVQLPPSWSGEVSGPEAVELLDHGGLGVFAEGGQVSGPLAGWRPALPPQAGPGVRATGWVPASGGSRSFVSQAPLPHLPEVHHPTKKESHSRCPPQRASQGLTPRPQAGSWLWSSPPFPPGSAWVPEGILWGRDPGWPPLATLRSLGVSEWPLGRG